MKKNLALFALLFSLTALGATEHAVSDFVPGTPPGWRDGPTLATDGGRFLAVWRDRREGALWHDGDGGSSLFAARITAAGEVLDPTGIRLTSESGGPPHVVWNGERYLVFFTLGDTIKLATVDRDGHATAPHTVLENAEDISVATNGSRIVIAYEGDRASVIPPRPYVALLDMNGVPIRNAAVATFRHAKLAPSAVAMTNGELVVAWNAFGRNSAFTVDAIRLDSAGERLTDAIGIGTANTETTLHANGDALVAVNDSATWGVSADLLTITAKRSSVGGEVFELQGRAAIVWHTVGSSADPQAIMISPIDADGHTTTNALDVAIATPAGRGVGRVSALESDGRLLLAWSSYDRSALSDFQLVATLVNAVLPWMPLTATFEMTASAPAQFDPAIAAGATESLVAWHELDGVYAARIDDAGRRLDGRGIRLAETMTAGAPRVVFHDGRYAVAFTEDNVVVVRFVTPEGDVLPGRVEVGSTRLQRIALASGGGTLLVVWSNGFDVLATRVHPSLTADPPVIVSSDIDMNAVDPAAAWNGAHFLVAWVGTYDFDRIWVRPRLYTRRVTPELGFAGASNLTLARSHWESIGMPAIASDGQDWFIALKREAHLFASEIYLTRFTASGEPGAEVLVASGSAPELVWTGSTLFLAYRPDNGALAVKPVVGAGTAEMIAGKTRNAPPGAIGSLPLFDQTGITWRNGRWIAAYQRIGEEDEGFVPRVFAAISGRTKGKARAIRP
ncbi:MAG: hypothetical protein ACXW31_06630 [Thermoanaerobaculia bacterium]